MQVILQVDELKAYGKELGVSEYVQWKLNVTFRELQEEMSQALIAIHTMSDEHFGIGRFEENFLYLP